MLNGFQKLKSFVFSFVFLFDNDIQNTQTSVNQYSFDNEQFHMCLPDVPKKMYLTLTLNFEAVTTLMSRILVFPAFKTYTIHLILYSIAFMA